MDFIAPEPVNPGTVITRNVTDPSPDPTTTSFDFTNNLVTDPADPADPSVKSFSLFGGGSKTVNAVLSGSYRVTEAILQPPASR